MAKTEFADIALADLLNDLASARMDLDACERLAALSNAPYPRLTRRIQGNRRCIAVIEQELRDRGEEVPE